MNKEPSENRPDQGTFGGAHAFTDAKVISNDKFAKVASVFLPICMIVSLIGIVFLGVAFIAMDESSTLTQTLEMVAGIAIALSWISYGAFRVIYMIVDIMRAIKEK